MGRELQRYRITVTWTMAMLTHSRDKHKPETGLASLYSESGTFSTLPWDVWEMDCASASHWAFGMQWGLTGGCVGVF